MAAQDNGREIVFTTASQAATTRTVIITAIEYTSAGGDTVTVTDTNTGDTIAVIAAPAAETVQLTINNRTAEGITVSTLAASGTLIVRIL